MDYSAFLIDIATLPPDLVVALASHSASLPLDISHSYFNDVHEGFNSLSRRIKVENAPRCVQRVVENVAHVFHPSQFWAYEVNELAIGGQIMEHTDQSSTVVSGHRVPMFHSLHVPLTGQGLYSFRRSQQQEWQSHHMVRGHCYLFNNYTLHKVDNVSDVVRYNMILHFIDQEWNTKRLIYERYNIKGLY